MVRCFGISPVLPKKCRGRSGSTPAVCVASLCVAFRGSRPVFGPSTLTPEGRSVTRLSARESPARAIRKQVNPPSTRQSAARLTYRTHQDSSHAPHPDPRGKPLARILHQRPVRSPSREPFMLSLPRSGRPKEQRGQPTAWQHSPSVRSPTLKETAPLGSRASRFHTRTGDPCQSAFCQPHARRLPAPRLSRSFHPIPPPPSQPRGRRLALVALVGYHVLGARAGPPKLHLRAISSRLPKKRRVSPSARRFLFPVVLWVPRDSGAAACALSGAVATSQHRKRRRRNRSTWLCPRIRTTGG
jgi:hypothetical protein